MLDERLVGYWSDEPLYQGSMEAADIAFSADGTGWTDWSRDGGPFHVYRFRWHTAGDRQLVLELIHALSGTWSVDGGTTRYRVQKQVACDERIVLAYELRAGQDALKRSARLLCFDQPVSPGTIGDRFALRHVLAEDERDPTSRTSTVRYQI